jgi:hypothetical protein
LLNEPFQLGLGHCPSRAYLSSVRSDV